MEVQEYKIIESPNLGSLAEKVNAALNEGWQPYGAPFGAVAGRCQAMVKFRRRTAVETSPTPQRNSYDATRNSLADSRVSITLPASS
jgi:hypothetical protein